MRAALRGVTPYSLSGSPRLIISQSRPGAPPRALENKRAVPSHRLLRHGRNPARLPTARIAVCVVPATLLGCLPAAAQTAPWLTPEAQRKQILAEIADVKLCIEWAGLM